MVAAVLAALVAAVADCSTYVVEPNLGMEANLSFWWGGQSNKFFNGKNLGELLIVLLLKRFDLASKVAVGVHQPPELYEGAHDRDIDFHSPSAAQHTRKHGDPLLGEGVRAIAAVAGDEVTICDLKCRTLLLRAGKRNQTENAACYGERPD